MSGPFEMNTPPRPLHPQASNPRPAHHNNTAARPGQMTAVMRTLAMANGPRIPRIAVVRNGRILDEHLIREATSVTVGTSERALIVVQQANNTLPASFVLLERVGDRYWLRFTEAMSGRVATQTGISSLTDLRSTAHVANGAYRIPLSDDARGKVIVGDTTFLFQLVPRPPVSPRPQLPLGVKSGMGFDWSLTIIAAFSFLLHFGIAGAMYSDWLDPVISADLVATGFISELDKLPKPQQPEIPNNDPATTTTPDPTKVVTPTPRENNNNTTRTTTNTNNTTPRSTNNTSNNEAARLMAQADAMEIDQLTVKANGSAVQKTIDRSNIPPVDMSKAAEANVAATHEHTDLKLGPGGPVVARNSKGLPGVLADNTKSTSNGNSGPDNGGPAGPTISVETQQPKMNGVISDADSVIAKLRPRLRKCYQDGLLQDPNMSGKAVIVAHVAPNGEVQSTDVGSNEGLSSGVTGCMQKVIGNATFTGNGTITTMRIPVTMLKQQR